MHLEIKQSTDRTETVSSQTIDKLYQLAFEDQNLGITSQLDATSDVQGRIEAPAAYEDAVRYLAGIDPGDTKRFQNLYINIPNQNYYVRFEDPVVSDYCMSLYGDGVGMTRTALAAVTTNDQLWSSNYTSKMPDNLKSQVTTLNDFQYFTGVSSTENIVLNFPNAASITFPNKTFYDSSAYMRRIVNNCGNIQYIDYNNAQFVKDLGNRSNDNVDVYRPINGNNVIVDLDDSHFPNQTDLNHIELFASWTKIQKIIYPEGITRIGGRSVGNSSLQYLEFPTTVTNIGKAAGFGQDNGHRIGAMVVKATTPPIWYGWRPNDTSNSGHGFGWDNFPVAIYVPDSAVNAYKSVVNNGTNSEQAWASPYIQDLIKPLSELPQIYRDMGTVTQEDIDRV